MQGFFMVMQAPEIKSKPASTVTIAVSQKSGIQTLYQIASNISYGVTTSSRKILTGMRRNPKLIRIVFFVLVTILLVLVGTRMLQSKPKTVQEQDTRAVIQGPKASMTINKEYAFPLYDDKNKEVTKFKYIVENAELRDEIIVQGQRAVSLKGKTFLVVSIKIINTYDKAININARDYVRISANGKTGELMAADIHNDPVIVQAISTKPTRLGFPVSDQDTDITLTVGEIKGTKQSIALEFR